MNPNNTPRANRLHIGIFGKRNSGKSSLINAITGHDTALVSEIAGTTTDPVYKSMEIHGLGPCVLIDTAGFDDEGNIGQLRMERTRSCMEKTDIALLVFTSGREIKEELEWHAELKKKNIPVIAVLNKGDIINDPSATSQHIYEASGLSPIIVSAKNKEGLDTILTAIMRSLPEDYDAKTITGNIAKSGDVVLLVMPQDIQAPKGRLILPQVQTIRELLDKNCVVLSATEDRMNEALQALSRPPSLIITDSQIFKNVYKKKPFESKLTSFSILFAGYKGDIDYYIESVTALDSLTENSRILIAEACTHAPLSEDIGRDKIPRMLRKKLGDTLSIDMVSGTDFPTDLYAYDFIIHCGACMFNRKYVLSRIEKARIQGVPMSNYGIVLAYLAGILDKISLH